MVMIFGAQTRVQCMVSTCIAIALLISSHSLAEDQRDVGQSIDNVAFQSLDGAKHKLSDFKTSKAIVVAITISKWLRR